MGIYAILKYGDETEKYGEAPRISFSVAPFAASATGYDTVQLTWAPPDGDITKIRLLRSQDGWSETEEDGVILWEWDSASGAPRIETFTDSPTASPLPLVSGRYAYYRVWILRDSTDTWLVAGDTLAIVPKAHDSVSSDGATLLSTHDKFMDLLPRVYTSENQSPLDVLDKTSELYRFLQGFSFTLDEIMTLADNILPEESGRYLSPELVILKTRHLGLEPEAYIATKNQKRLVREAVYMLSNKGTPNAIQTYAEALTGLAPVVSSSPNILLSVQDSSFYKGLGFWQVVGNGVLSLEQSVIPPSTTLEPNAIDTAYCAKLVTSAANVRVQNGTQNSRTTGSPVVAGTNYTFSFYTQGGTSNTVIPKIYWYDYLGNLVKTTTGTSSAVASGTWAKASLSGVAPGQLLTVASYARTSDVVTLTVDKTAGYNIGDAIQVYGVATAVDGDYVITGVTTSTITYAKTGTDIATTSVTTGNVLLQSNPAAFAGLELTIGSAGTVWVDMVQLANSSITSYYEARAVDVFLNPKKTNEIKNPSFEGINSTNWTITPSGSSSGSSVVNDSAVAGTKALEIPLADGAVTTLATTSGTIDDGRFFTYSIYVKQLSTALTNLEVADNVAIMTFSATPSTWAIGDVIAVSSSGTNHDFIVGTHTLTAVTATTASFALDYADVASAAVTDLAAYLPETLTVKLNGFDASLPVGSQVFDVHSEEFTTTDEWVRYHKTGYISGSPNAITINATVYGTTQGGTIRVDNAQLEAAYSPTDYFDGNSPESYGAVWEGTVNSSRSHIYPNKIVKTLRLAETLRDYLPINRPHTIRTYAGIEHKVIE